MFDSRRVTAEKRGWKYVKLNSSDAIPRLLIINSKASRLKGLRCAWKLCYVFSATILSNIFRFDKYENFRLTLQICASVGLRVKHLLSFSSFNQNCDIPTSNSPVLSFQFYPFRGFLAVPCGWTDRRYGDAKKKFFCKFSLRIH